MQDALHAVAYTNLTAPSKLFVRAMQHISRFAVPRGLPRIGWVGRRIFLGKGFKKINYRNRFHICCDTDSYHNVMFGYGIENRQLEQLFTRILKPGDVFFDIGANIGMVTLQACSTPHTAGQIDAHCFEPDPNAFAWLKTNCDLNSFRITLNQCAIGMAQGKADLTISTVSGWSTMASEPPDGFSFLTKAAKTMVDVLAIDDYCCDKQVTPALVKIDVEGFETEVVRGAAKTLTTAKPILIIEVNPMRLKSANSSDGELFELLASYGYQVFHIDPKKISTTADRQIHDGMPEARANDVREGEISDVLGIALTK